MQRETVTIASNARRYKLRMPFVILILSSILQLAVVPFGEGNKIIRAAHAPAADLDSLLNQKAELSNLENDYRAKSYSASPSERAARPQDFEPVTFVDKKYSRLADATSHELTLIEYQVQHEQRRQASLPQLPKAWALIALSLGILSAGGFSSYKILVHTWTAEKKDATSHPGI
jgi:hypothetical protein